MDKKYCDGLDCAMCRESEPCIYKEANKLQKQIDTLEQECNKLKQTLAEIKEICNEYQKEYILNIGVEILTKKILQII